MQYKSRLIFYVWPLLAIIATICLIALVVPFPAGKSGNPTPPRRVSSVKFRPPRSLAETESQGGAEIRTLYASDLFASSRNERFPQPGLATNWTYQTNTPLNDRSLPAFPRPETAAACPEKTSISSRTSSGEADSLPLTKKQKKTTAPRQKHAEFSIELKGELKDRCSAADLLGALTPPQDKKPWTFQAEMRFDNHGAVEHIFVESADCPPELYREIAQTLFHCRLNGVTQSCASAVIISYPAYTAAAPAPPPAQ